MSILFFPDSIIQIRFEKMHKILICLSKISDRKNWPQRRIGTRHNHPHSLYSFNVWTVLHIHLQLREKTRARS